MTQLRKRNKSLGLVELIAIVLGGMVGGGIFTILGISVSMIGSLTPIAIILGGSFASLAAYSYVKLGLYYKDEGATYSFFKKTYPSSKFSASAIGWFIMFGYISTLALYAYTFSSYAISSSEFAGNIWFRKGIAIAVIAIFTLVNIWSVNGMGKLEDIMVYTKLIILALITFVLIKHRTMDLNGFINHMKLDLNHSSAVTILIVASITFVSYEGFQLVINAVSEMTNPDKNIPRAIYGAILLAILIYVGISVGALLSIPTKDIIQNKEYALASGAEQILGKIGSNLVIFGAVLATSSAINGTIFGSSRQMAVIAKDGFFPKTLSIKKSNIPQNAIIGMATLASILIMVGGLELILEFGSITFLLVSLLMAVANHKIRDKTNSSKLLTLLSIFGLSIGAFLILYFEFTTQWEQMIAIILIYGILSFGAWRYSKKVKTQIHN